MKKKFLRTRDKKIGGVCGGIANYIDMDVVLVRLIYTFATIFTCFAAFSLTYIIMWIFVPIEPKVIETSTETTV